MADLTLHFVRHGESLANDADRAGASRGRRTGTRLSERGWEQARGLGRRLEGHGLELIVASTMRRAQETAEGIDEVLGLPIETDPDLHELRQSDAFYASARQLRRHGDAELDADRCRATTPSRAPSPSTTCSARALRVRERMEARAGDERILLVSHYGFLHFFLGLALFGDAFGPEHLVPLWYAGHANTGHHRLRAPQRAGMDGIDFDGWHPTTWNDQAHLDSD